MVARLTVGRSDAGSASEAAPPPAPRPLPDVGTFFEAEDVGLQVQRVGQETKQHGAARGAARGAPRGYHACPPHHTTPLDAPRRTTPHPTAPHRTAPHRTAPHQMFKAGDYENAMRMFEKSMSLPGSGRDFNRARSGGGGTSAVGGAPNPGGGLFEQVFASKEEVQCAKYNMACCQTAMGNTQRGLELLEEVLDSGFTDFDTIRKDSTLSKLGAAQLDQVWFQRNFHAGAPLAAAAAATTTTTTTAAATTTTTTATTRSPPISLADREVQARGALRLPRRVVEARQSRRVVQADGAAQDHVQGPPEPVCKTGLVKWRRGVERPVPVHMCGCGFYCKIVRVDGAPTRRHAPTRLLSI